MRTDQQRQEAVVLEMKQILREIENSAAQAASAAAIAQHCATVAKARLENRSKDSRRARRKLFGLI